MKEDLIQANSGEADSSEKFTRPAEVEISISKANSPFVVKHDTDVVPRDIIRLCAATCEQTECRFVVAYKGGTLLGHAGTFYERDGSLNADDNPNLNHYVVFCQTCRNGWNVIRKGSSGIAGG